MRKPSVILCLLSILLVQVTTAQPDDYLRDVKTELQKKWPANRCINLVFHGHSVPAGYFRTPDVRTLEAYPAQVLQELKKLYPTAVINVIVTAIGGENAEQGAKRFRKTVMIHRPDVLFIDYALNDRKLGLERSKKAMGKMIREALKKRTKVILLTPSPDTSGDWAAAGSELDLFTKQLTDLATQYKIGLVDSYARFKKVTTEKKNLQEYMAQSNHPNKNGHALIADEVMRYFR